MILLLRSGGCYRRPSSSMVKSEFFPPGFVGCAACVPWCVAWCIPWCTRLLLDAAAEPPQSPPPPRKRRKTLNSFLKYEKPVENVWEFNGFTGGITPSHPLSLRVPFLLWIRQNKILPSNFVFIWTSLDRDGASAMTSTILTRVSVNMAGNPRRLSRHSSPANLLPRVW